MAELTFQFSQLSDKEVQAILEQYSIDLTVDEARRVETDILGRAVTLTEAIAFGIEGSEHTSYRSSRPYLKQFHTEGPHVVVGPGEDAGVVWIDKVGEKDFCIAVAHESHNHPSQVVPYEGAATGIGGIVRDVVCMGAKVVALADPLRFGNKNSNKTKWLADGVVSGIGGYGNPLGIPNIAGDVGFNDSFNSNCLVNVVAVGTVAMDDIIHSRTPENSEGYSLILVGKPTDNSGFGGAAFSSADLNADDAEANKSAVQEPNAFLERHVISATYDLFDVLKEKGLMGEVGFKDLGAGGVLCASVELVEAGGYGARIDVEKIHTSMDNLQPAVIVGSETQERWMWSASPRATEVIMKHYNEAWDLPNVSMGAAASIVGTVQKGNFQVFHEGEMLVDAKPEDVTAGLSYDREVKEQKYNGKEPKWTEVPDIEDAITAVLSHPEVASKKPIYERYDKDVQGLVVIQSGMADAGVIAPLIDEGSKVGVALSVDGNPRHGAISPYWQGANAVVEGMRNVAAVGATPWCLTDCLNYGNPEDPNQMWQFTEGVRGVAEAAKAIHVKGYENAPTPVVSGNVSMYNQSKDGSINPSAIVGTIGRLADAASAVTFDFLQQDNVICLIGERKNELGGSILYDLYNELGVNIPQPDFKEVQNEVWFMTDLIEQGLVPTCHDISDGGLITTLAEMSFGGRGEQRMGIDIDLNDVPGEGLTTTQKLFSETGGFVFEVDPRQMHSVQEQASKYNLTVYPIGVVKGDKTLTINTGDSTLVNLPVGTLAEHWLNGLRNTLK